MPRRKKRRKTKAKPAVRAAALLLMIAAAFAYKFSPQFRSRLAAIGVSPAFEKPIETSVVKVIDGDTVLISGGQKVRLIGVDTLETRRGKRLEGQAGRLGLSVSKAEKWGRRAKKFTRSELLHKSVELRAGYERFDRYNRLLAYIWYKPDDDEPLVCFNRLLIEEGLALATRRFRHPKLDEFLEAEAEAKRKKKGFWAYAKKN